MDDGTLPAGSFSSWLSGMQRALRGAGASDVACGTCTACCTSSQFVHVGPDEAETLAGIPRALLFPAPGLPEGHLVMGYDEAGHCPMFRDGGCSIYEHRPRSPRAVAGCLTSSAPCGAAPWPRPHWWDRWCVATSPRCG